VPDIRKVKNTLIGQVKLDRAYVKFYGGKQGYGKQQSEVDGDQHFTGSVVFQFM